MDLKTAMRVFTAIEAMTFTPDGMTEERPCFAVRLDAQMEAWEERTFSVFVRRRQTEEELSEDEWRGVLDVAREVGGVSVKPENNGLMLAGL